MKKNYINLIFALVCLFSWQIQSNAQTAISAQGFEAGCAGLNLSTPNCAATFGFGWHVDANGTGSANTGPSAAIEGNNYLYLETSGGSFQTSNYTMAPVFLGGIAASPFSLSFERHMFGATMGTLNVGVSTDGGMSYTNEFTLSGDQGTSWNNQVIDLNSYAGSTVTIRFQGIQGSSFTGDMAIDDIQFLATVPVCELTCPAPQSLDNDSGECGAFANVVAIVDQICNNPVTNDFNGGGADASGVYPVGTTTITFSTTDDFGNAVTCSTTVTVADTEAPSIDCPAGIVLHLDPGACDAIVDYSLNATDNCNLIANANTVSTLNAANNGNAAGGVVFFDVTNLTSSPLPITSLDLSIDGSSQVDVYLTTASGSSVGNQTNIGAWTLVSSGTAAGAFGPGNLATVPVNFSIPPGQYGVAIHGVSSGQNYSNGNGGNQSYSDGILQIDLGTTMNGFFTGGVFNPRVWNGSLTYSQNVPFTPIVTTLAGLPSGSTFPIGTTTIIATATDLAGNTATCTFPITVNEYQVQSNVITCNSLVNISLDENCEAVVGADQILEGNDYGCYDTYDVTFAGTGLPLIK